MKRAFLGSLLLLTVAVVTVAIAAAHHSRSPLPPRELADRIVVDKSNRTLTLYREGHALKTYPVALGRQPVGSKEREGDDRTPEGLYFIDSHNPRSQYHAALHVSYPNAQDMSRARRAGYSAGGDIMVHGLPSGIEWLGPLHRAMNWTHGCIAVTNHEIDEIARAVPDGTPIYIQP